MGRKDLLDRLTCGKFFEDEFGSDTSPGNVGLAHHYQRVGLYKCSFHKCTSTPRAFRLGIEEYGTRRIGLSETPSHVLHEQDLRQQPQERRQQALLE
jgi:hypothetical protein